MSKVLLVGDYYPHASIKSFFIELISRKLKAEGHEVIILSDAWCNDFSELFGDVEFLSNNLQFKKRFFIDPIQLRYSGNDILLSYLGLACKILDTYEVDFILYLDKIENAPLIELIKNRYKINVQMIIDDINMYKCMDDYIYPFLTSSLKFYDKIYTFLPYKAFLSHFLKLPNDKIADICKSVSVIDQHGNVQESKRNSICVLAASIDDNKHKSLDNIIQNISKTANIYYFAMINNTENDEIKSKIIPFHEITNFNLLNMVIAFDDELLGTNENEFGKQYLISSLIGCPVLIKKDKLLNLMNYYEVKYHDISDNYCVIHTLNQKD